MITYILYSNLNKIERIGFTFPEKLDTSNYK